MQKWKDGWKRRCQDEVRWSEGRKRQKTVDIGEWGLNGDMDDVQSLPREEREKLWESEVLQAARHCRTLEAFDKSIQSRRIKFPASSFPGRLPASMTPADPWRRNIFDCYMTNDEHDIHYTFDPVPRENDENWG